MSSYTVRCAIVENSKGVMLGELLEPKGLSTLESGVKQKFNVVLSNPCAYMVEDVLVDNKVNATGSVLDTGSVEIYGDGDHTISVSVVERHSVELITPELAKNYLDMMVGNRRPNQNKIHAYSDMMRRGEWRTNDEDIKFNTDGHLCDGQHRLLAVIDAGIPVRMTVVRGCNKDDVTTYDTGMVRGADATLSINGGRGECARGIISYCGLSKGYSVDTINHTTIKVSYKDILEVYNADREYWHDLYDFSRRLREGRHGSKMMPDKLRIMGVIAFLEKTKGYDRDFVRWFFKTLADPEDTSNQTITTMRATLTANFVSKVKFTNSELWSRIMFAFKRVQKGDNGLMKLRFKPVQFSNL